MAHLRHAVVLDPSMRQVAANPCWCGAHRHALRSSEVRTREDDLRDLPPSPDCPFIRRLLDLLFMTSIGTSPAREKLLFNELLTLEMDAERQRAPDESLRVITTVRHIAGRAMSAVPPAGMRGH